MSENDQDNPEPQEQRTNDADDVFREKLLEEQEHKGYGADEGEREESLPE